MIRPGTVTLRPERDPLATFAVVWPIDPFDRPDPPNPLDQSGRPIDGRPGEAALILL